ncbi:hypothetical protein WICANDRAFT_60568 [Wickerhamomyces anomalus NRRL Y-366-8]|uniref:HTH La-type RNA-binding domain-containing protein n=1 Tax=Wickerhamomyces anomalus (strain ATCC 58044 / CBS 1984 / NCYC 433 / NRRL Y-366-8) TaxID=683960 RepID=A0A1E3PB42_WICAA|nr:uncharacterized protein WICANDRAFT_60568 [Wickerhamomyces anomalus NRRL Y-366-8]ODQ62510.1 hypothetical protein WICANDRAFT_60568 [Wickerhamomyces anomalus NRRL Y-366-8]
MSEAKEVQAVESVEVPKTEEVTSVEEPVVESKTEVTEEDKKEEQSEAKPEDAKADDAKLEEPKSEETKTEEAASEFEPEEVLKQVEFYFSDSNLPKDKFLWRTVQSNQEGWVSISTIASFNRMKKFRPLSAVVDALKKSEFLVVSENGEMIKRKNPILPPSDSDKQSRFQRSIYAKGFGEETPTTQEDLEAFFQPFGKINEVRLRRDDNKKFKESVFVEFADSEDAKKFLELSEKPKYKDNELLIMSKPAYVEMKANNENFGGNKNNKKRKFNGFKNGKRGGNFKRSRN